MTEYLYRSMHIGDDEIVAIEGYLVHYRIHAEYRMFRTGGIAYRVPMEEAFKLPHDEETNTPYLPSITGGYGMYEEVNEDFYDEMSDTEWRPVIRREHSRIREIEEGRFSVFPKILTGCAVIAVVVVPLMCIALFLLSR